MPIGRLARTNPFDPDLGHLRRMPPFEARARRAGVAIGAVFFALLGACSPSASSDVEKTMRARYHGAHCTGIGPELTDCGYISKESCEHYVNDISIDVLRCFPKPTEIFCDIPPADDPSGRHDKCFRSRDACKEYGGSCVRVALGPAPAPPKETGSLTPDSVQRVRQQYAGRWCVSSKNDDKIRACQFSGKAACEASRPSGVCIERPAPLVCSYGDSILPEGGRLVVCHSSIDTCRRHLAPQAECTEVRFEP
ncbi:Hypothetical protein A7982_00906 [Minicystis rosea]|nr:Hypothetical protein A7982_00906 [Minicystis rosea]